MPAAIAGGIAGTFVFGQGLWRSLAPAWPGGGRAFAVSAGFLMVATPAVALAAATWFVRLRRKGRRQAWLLTPVAGAFGLLCVLSLMAFLVSFGGRRRRPRPGCDTDDFRCWLSTTCPYAAAYALGGAAVAGLLMWGGMRFARRAAGD
ncbi:hypothetical protein [Streptomyces sp. 8N616]|uniref:hypothetical protein n=1 Tax=Streptomyces sp. 8N616 TaxID=3457414 RepID=UPI003FD2B133